MTILSSRTTLELDGVLLSRFALLTCSRSDGFWRW